VQCAFPARSILELLYNALTEEKGFAMCAATRVVSVIVISCGLLSAEGAGGRVEFTGSYWLPNIRGAVRSGANSIDLRGDLGIEQQRLTSFGSLVLKPGRKHGIVVEGTPFRLRGVADIARQFRYQNREFFVADTAQSAIDLLYLFGGYRYNVVQRQSGHLGLIAGVAYLNAEGSIRSIIPGTNISATESRMVALPLGGGEFHRNLTPGKHPVSIAGDAKGMWAGEYGQFALGTLQFGFGVMKNLTIRAGYGVTQLNLHTKNQSVLFKSTFAGPVFSIHVRDR
jgi:hypothetical protein